LTRPKLGNGSCREEKIFWEGVELSEIRRDLPIHRWVPWIAGFSAQFVDDCLSNYLPDNGKGDYCVLDPFAGVGTTLVQAYTKGFNVVGFEINPYAALASKVKLEAAGIN
jgi:hypothetical protein